MKTTTATLHGAAIRPWDSPELKASYWAGAHYARQAWIDKNQALGDNYARKVGLLK